VGEQASFGSVAQCVEAGAVEPSSRVPIVEVFLDRLLAKLGHLVV
jgi:hypothetical protein